MTADDFTNWLAAIKAAGLAKSDADCARLLQVHVNSIVLMKRQGADHRTALACRALFHRLEPWTA